MPILVHHIVSFPGHDMVTYFFRSLLDARMCYLECLLVPEFLDMIPVSLDRNLRLVKPSVGKMTVHPSQTNVNAATTLVTAYRAHAEARSRGPLWPMPAELCARSCVALVHATKVSVRKAFRVRVFVIESEFGGFVARLAQLC